MRNLLACFLAASFWASAPAAAAPVLRDDRGAVVTLAATPRRIVSLLPSSTESVCAIGACASLVGTDRFSNWPASVRTLPKLGGLDDVQIEAVVALRPDVVLVSTSARVTDRLEALGLKVVAFDSSDRADVRHMLVLLGRMLGAEAAADQVWADIVRQTERAAARVPAAVRGKRVYFEIDPTPYAAGPASFIGQMLARIGMTDALPGALGPFPKLNPEYVVRLQPDIIMASPRSIAEMPRRPGWSSLHALQEGQTCGFSSSRYELLTRSGPRMGEAANILADCLAHLPRRH